MKKCRYRIPFYLAELTLLAVLLIAGGAQSGPAAIWDDCAAAVLSHLVMSALHGVFDALLRWRMPPWEPSMKKTGDRLGVAAFLLGLALACAHAFHAAPALLFFGINLMLLAAQLVVWQRDALQAQESRGQRRT